VSLIVADIIITLDLNKRHSLYIKKSLKHKFNWPMIKKILSIGVPTGSDKILEAEIKNVQRSAGAGKTVGTDKQSGKIDVWLYK